MKQNDLKKFREEINKIDKKIINLLCQRLKVVKKIGGYKRKNGLRIYDKQREKEMLDNLKKKAEKNCLDKNYLMKLFKIIIKNSKKAQK